MSTRMIDIHPADPVFIQGILPRSGTNFLWDLLLLHPDCGRARGPVNEDLFLDHSDPLVAFVAAVNAAWDPRWGTFSADLPEHLHAAIGEGLVSFLWTDRSRRLVSKSPSVRNLDRFFEFFPWARLLILVRDGRSVVQSAVDTFGWDFDRAARAWAEAADVIRRFQQTEVERHDRWRLVRFEDLVKDPEPPLREIFDFLGLDASRYDFDAARNLPVRGSSAFGREDGQVHWEAVAKNAAFTPTDRWRSWSSAQLKRFDWLVGSHLVDFGYAPLPAGFSMLERLQHTIGDYRWQTARMARVFLYQLRRRAALRRRLAATLNRLRSKRAAS